MAVEAHTLTIFCGKDVLISDELLDWTHDEVYVLRRRAFCLFPFLVIPVVCSKRERERRKAWYLRMHRIFSYYAKPHSKNQLKLQENIWHNGVSLTSVQLTICVWSWMCVWSAFPFLSVYLLAGDPLTEQLQGFWASPSQTKGLLCTHPGWGRRVGGSQPVQHLCVYI